MAGTYASWGIHVPTDVLVWIATSPLRQAVYRLQGLYGVARFLHIVGTAGFVGLLSFVNLRGCGGFAGSVPASATRAMLGVARWMFAVTLASGVLLFLFDPIQVGSHTMFLPKLILLGLGLGLAVAYAFHAGLGRGVALRAGSAVSLIVWVGVIACSVWNHAERPLKPIRALDGIERYTE